MRRLKYLTLLMPIMLSACNDGSPSKEDIAKLMTYRDDHIGNDDEYVVTDKKCTKHENEVYFCSVTYHKKILFSTMVSNETMRFVKIDGKWATNWSN